MDSNAWTPPPVPPAGSTETPRRRRGVVIGAGLVGAGVVAGAIIGGTVLSDAATSSPTPNASSSSSPEAPGAPGTSQRHGPGGELPLSGTVTAVGSSAVTIKTSTGTTEYKVDSDIDKNGEAKLSDLKVGDAVRFSVTPSNVIAILHAGDEALNRPQGPGRGHGPGGQLSLSGTVTAVGSSSVTIKTSTGTTEYKVDSDIDKNGEAKLSDLRAGDAVRFSVTPSNVIAILHAGDEALNRPQGPGPGSESGG
jgi:preprotein translocase subunit YajC